MRRINSGKYRIPITIQKRTASVDTYGASTEVWSTVVNTRAGIFPISATERFTADVITNELTHKIHIRYIPNNPIIPSMRISYGTRLFYITSIINVEERNVELQLICAEIVK
jgi:SPP1 family predicted phage head-tail adaptor